MMRTVRILIAAVFLAMCATSVTAQDYRRQLQAMNYHELSSIDPQSLDDRQRRTFNDVKSDRDKEIARAYERTQTVRNEFTATSTVVSPDDLILTEDNCPSLEGCIIILRRKIQNKCGQRGYGLSAEYEFCNYSSAYARGGTQLSLTRQDFDIDSRTSTRLVGMPAACSTCRSTQRRVTDVHRTYKETYLIGVPLELLRATAASGDLAIQLSSVRENNVTTVEQEGIIGFLRAVDEAFTTR